MASARKAQPLDQGRAVELNAKPVVGNLTDHQEEQLPCQGHHDGQEPLETTRVTGRATSERPTPFRPPRHQLLGVVSGRRRPR